MASHFCAQKALDRCLPHSLDLQGYLLKQSQGVVISLFNRLEFVVAFEFQLHYLF